MVQKIEITILEIIIEMFIPIVIGALGAVTKDLIKGLEDLEIRGRWKTTQTIALLRSARIPRRVQETCCHTNSSERPSAKTDVKKLLWHFNIQTDHLIPARRPDLIIINKKKKKKKKKENLQNCRLCCPGGPQNKSEGK